MPTSCWAPRIFSERIMIIPLTPHIPSAQEAHELDLWTRAECYRFYVSERRSTCTFLERMDLWLRAPVCEGCILSDPFHQYQLPDISSSNWKNDIAWKLGEDILASVTQELEDDPEFAFRCKRCHRDLAPWNGDAVHVVPYHLEEHYGIPLYTPGQKKPSEKVRKQILKLYGNVCFACGSVGPGVHIDHILPQSSGGDAVFRNLQPLCEACGQRKGHSLPENIDVWSNIYFGREPSDGYEGLFW